MRKHQRILLAGFAAVSLAQLATATEYVSGSGARGSMSQTLRVGNGAALLNSFDFNFGFGNDHQLRLIRALPDENGGAVYTAYSDKNGNDPYSFQVGFEPLTDSSIIERDAAGRCRGQCNNTIQIPAGYTFVLRGFESKFANADHHIKTLGTELSGTNLRVYMYDKNGDDLYDWRVRYALVPNRLIAATQQSSGSGVGSSSVAIASGRIVLRGFMLSYTGTDHHISRVAIKPQNGTLKVFFHDKNADDNISWRVQWARLK